MPTDKTKILFVSRAYGSNAGGMERFSYELIQNLKNHPNVDATVLARETKPGDSLFASRMKSMLYAATIVFPALRKARDAEIIHLGDPLLSKLGWMIKLLYKKPIAISIHGLDVTYPAAWYQLYLKMFLGNFDLYIPISDYAKQRLEKHSVSGKIEVIPPGIAHVSGGGAGGPPAGAQHLRAPDGSTAPTGPETRPLKLLTTGRLVKRKGHEWFIRNVFPQLPDSFTYTIAGDGPEFSTLQETIKQLDLVNRVRLLGRVTPEKLEQLYNDSTYFIQPNIKVEGDAEGFGLVMLEASLHNLPVFAANIDGIPTAIHHQKNGILIKPQNAVAWKTALTTYKGSLENTRQYTLENYSWRVITPRFSATIRALADIQTRQQQQS